MKDQAPALLVGTLTTVFAVLGLFLWARATDTGIAVFGCSLLVFGIAANFSLINWYYNQLEAETAARRLEASNAAEVPDVRALAEVAG